MRNKKVEQEKIAAERRELIVENRRLRRESRALLCLLNGHSPDEEDYEPPVAATRRIR